MSTSSRDEEARLYTHSNAGGGGYEGEDTFTFVADRWAAFGPPGYREATVAQVQQRSVDIVVTLADESMALLTLNGGIKRRATGELFLISGWRHLKQLREVEVDAVRNLDASAAVFVGEP